MSDDPRTDDPAATGAAGAAWLAPSSAPDPSPMRFAGAVALVVGAGHGIGAATARRLAAEGASVIVADLDLGAARETAGDLAVEGEAEHLALGIDVTDRADVDRALAAVEAAHGRLDVLAHVAGGNLEHPGPEEIDDEPWHRLLDLNLMGPVRTCRAALPLLRRADRAAIVTVSSVNAFYAIGGEPYSAAKAALLSFTRNLASAYAADGIRANAVAPGTVLTRVWQDDAEKRLEPWYPLGRVGRPEDVAAAIAFLASADAAWITGQVLRVDGGLELRGPGPA
ncbi:SDR family NAD(P)-dependent oxidoreductase [Brachybacterium huguangmaarense]